MFGYETINTVYLGSAPTSSTNSNGIIVAVENGTEVLYPNNSIKRGRTFIWGEFVDKEGKLVPAWRYKKTGAQNLHLNDYFPSWSSQKTMEEIAFARSRLKPINKKVGDNNEWIIPTSEGNLNMHMYIGDNGTNIVPDLTKHYGSAFTK